MGIRSRALLILRELLVDAPRCQISIDSIIQDCNPVELFFDLQARFGTNIGLALASRCTQGWLAHWYSNGVDKLCTRNSHLLNDGLQVIYIRSSPEPHLYMTKPFKIASVNQFGELFNESPVLLSLSFTPSNSPHTVCRWITGDEADWVLI